MSKTESVLKTKVLAVQHAQATVEGMPAGKPAEGGSVLCLSYATK